ncbi:MAG: hypothetical protein HY821_00025 [Acidobacteria bacterium]|nr:hypothetical protein [Acidobacteriota bacterium]
MGDITGIKTASGYELQNVMNWGGAVTNDADPSVCYYQHFDLTMEQLGRTWRYNCWGFTFLPRRYWINSSADVDMILADNCSPVASGSLRPGDVIRYRDSYNVTTHTGRVWQVNGAGQCVKVRSKWGSLAEYIHDPLTVPVSYGTNLAYFRQNSPLRGIGDLFVHDASTDTGEQVSPNLWASPDIAVDAPPYGSVDVNPVFGQVNRVWAVVYNRGTKDITTARVRYYWANPYAGFASANWQLIPATAGHPNPTNVFTVAAGGSATAPYVEWTPQPVMGVPDPAHQCLLAITYVNDDPTDSSNPDPIVYPFDISWDNNICARNVHILTMDAGTSNTLTLFTGLPDNIRGEAHATLRVRLRYVPRLPVLGFPREIVPPRVEVSLDGAPRVSLPGLARPVALHEKWQSQKELKKVAVVAQKPRKIQLRITAPPGATRGSNYMLEVQQEINGVVTGGYTVAVTINR